MKYEFTGEVKVWCGIRLKRFRAIATFAGIAKGEVGGWIEKEENLSQVSGDAWVYENARVYGNALVYGDARVYGNALVYGDARVSDHARVYGDARVYGNALVYGHAQVSGDALVYGDARVYGNALVYGHAQISDNASLVMVGPIGSRNAQLTVTADADIGVRFSTGCFTGSRDQFVAAVAKTHASGKFRQQYDLALALADCSIVAGVPDEAT